MCALRPEYRRRAYDVNNNHEGVSIVSSFWDRERLLRSTILAGFAAAAFTVAPSFAQQADDEDDEDEEAQDASRDSVVVTGSRIRRDEFSSTSPLQVINADTIADAGLVDTAEILRSTPVVQGAQLDATINNAFVTNGGPGVNNVSLRGLTADRTLILINGRRMAPAGVEGAPAFPDINLIPSSIIERVDILLDGASSVYGSDAVAGVINVITRQDYEGLNVDAYYSSPEDSGGAQQRYSMLVGDRGQNGGFTFAFEYFDQDNLKVNDRNYNREANSGLYCSQDLELDANGNLLSRCGGGAIIDRVRIFNLVPFPGAGLVDANGNSFPGNSFYTDRVRLNGALQARGTDVYQDARGGGQAAVPFAGWFTGYTPLDYGNVSRAHGSDLLSEYDDVLPSSQRYNFFLTGDYDIDSFFGIEGTTAFFEASHSNSQTFLDSQFHGQLFPTVPDTNPFNPFQAGAVGLGVVPIIASPFQRSDVDVEIQQTRFLTGLRGDLGFMGAPSWDFETFAGYTRSIGYSARGAVLNERMLQTINTTQQTAPGVFSCGTPDAELFGFLDTDPCVPVNFFAPSLYIYDPAVGPSFATQAEFDYLAAERTVTTLVDEFLAGGFITGPLFSLADGEVSGVLGWEFRETGLDSGVDTVAATGSAAGYFADRLSVGSVNMAEYYGEMSFPLLQGRRFAEDVTLDVAARLTDHEFYGQNTTWSARASWSPNTWLTFRGTAGTSFRAPNVRELFLGGQTGFASGTADPCVLPLGVDTRNATIIANCQADGVDPFTLGAGGFPSIESFRAGNPNLDPETSDSISMGFAFDQPFTDAFDFQFGVNYFEINIEDSIAIPGTAFSLSRCYNSTNYPNDPFCARRQRDPNTGFLLFVDNTPFNISTQTSEGFDLNGRFGMDIFFNARLEANAVFTRTNEISNQTTATSAVNDLSGTIGYPEWRGTMDARILAGDWTFYWRGRYIGEQDNLGIFGAAEPATELGGVDVIDDVDSVLYHDVSVAWSSDTWTLRAGINNVANEDPPLVDQNTADATLGGTNVPLGAGYDLIGRRIFVNVSKRF
tara:strand:- start:2590 stop:5757 length:3168 start_codon:yes stop_codon:yes gene_type:complete